MSVAAIEFMERALDLAALGANRVSPNPRVGCVIVKGNRIVGEGWHRNWGGPHAEVEALAVAGDQAAGATVFVTLEPCCHQGKTPPCVEALIEAGVAEVVAATIDPNPLVAGKGLEALAEAGIKVSSGLCRERAEALNRGFRKRMSGGLPYLRCKIAASLDGRTALSNGISQWITGELSRQDVHRLRGQSDAIVTGIDTVLADDPKLDIRFGGSGENPVRVVLDSQLRMPTDATMFGLPGRTLIFTGTENPEKTAALRQKGAEVMVLPREGEHLCLRAVTGKLGDMGCNDLWLEAGPTLSGAFFGQGLVDELVLYLAPHFLGPQGRPLVMLQEIETMRERLELRLQDVSRLGEDIRLTYNPLRVQVQDRPGTLSPGQQVAD